MQLTGYHLMNEWWMGLWVSLVFHCMNEEQVQKSQNMLMSVHCSSTVEMVHANVLQVPLGLYLELTGQIQQGRDPGRLRTCWSEHISHLEDPAVSQDQVAGKRMSGLMCLVCLLAKFDTYTATLSLCVSEIHDQADFKNDIVSMVWTFAVNVCSL